MPVVAFNHYNLRAPRSLLEELRRFYCEVVGLKVGERPAFSSFGYWLYAGASDVLHLTETRLDESRSAGGLATFDHAAFSCTDPAAYERELKARGIPFELDRVPGSGRIQLFFKDPAGNGVELNFPAERG